MGSTANVGTLAAPVPDDDAPESGTTIPVAGANAGINLGPISR